MVLQDSYDNNCNVLNTDGYEKFAILSQWSQQIMALDLSWGSSIKDVYMEGGQGMAHCGQKWTRGALADADVCNMCSSVQYLVTEIVIK